MPKATQKSKRNVNDSIEDAEEYMPSQASSSQATLTQAERAISGISEEDKKRRVNDLVQYLLLMEQKKMPVKRQDINKHVLKEMSRAFPLMISKAEKVLQQVFGYKLVEVEGKQKCYILVNSIESDAENKHLEWSDTDNSRLGLVMIILSVIFMNGNETLSEGILWHALEKLGINKEDKNHDVFGDVRKLITQDLVRQCYIEYLRVPNSDPPTYDFKWGARAKAETTKRKVLEFVCKIYGGMEPEKWKGSYQQVLDDEQGEQVMIE